ncbi:lethal giant larvae like, C-terminal-domain-containing protein [Geopyxis carbonaria]|nr:lethal giant larvae like, C-terminal-domain-containing protein [Geopyxis carbonaria]
MDFLRAKQAGVAADFTGPLATSADVFILDEVARYGFNSTISTLSYDAHQSLLAVGTHAHGTTSGSVHVFGQKRVHVAFHLRRCASVKLLRLCDTKILVLDSKNELTIFDLTTPGARGAEYSPPGVVTAMEVDAALDWCFLGLQSGEVVAYDIDREQLAPWRMGNYWRERSPKARLLPVVALQLHPKDVGTLLVAYTEGAVVYSFKQGAAVHYLAFELPPGAPGADTELAAIRTARRPKLAGACWHPTGTFVLTSHEDGVMAVWSARDGGLVTARTLQDADVHLPGAIPGAGGGGGEGFSVRQPIFKAAWCSARNPDDTALLVAGGGSMALPTPGLTLLDLGPTPNMLTSSVQVVSDHFASPRRTRVLPTPTGGEVVDFCVLPRASSYYGGTHDPVAVLALLGSGELATLRYPDGAPLAPAALYHPSLSMQHLFPSLVDVAVVARTRWLGMVEQRPGASESEIVVGGVEHRRPLKRHQNRTLAVAAHPDGRVRVWDMGHADEVENPAVIELDVGRVLRRSHDLTVDAVAVAGETGEAAVGMETGEVVVFRWGVNKGYGRSAEDEEAMAGSRTAGEIAEGVVDVQARADPALKEGLLPLCMLRQQCGGVVALTVSDVGFVAVAYATGHLCVLDLRGPAVIYHESLTSLSNEQKRSSFRKSAHQPQAGEKATALEFGVMTLEGDEFSSIALFVGTSSGRVITFKLLPSGAGYTCVPSGATTSSDDAAILSLHPLNALTGAAAPASPPAVAGLRNGTKTPGVLLSVTATSLRLFRPATSKGAHKTLPDGTRAVAAAVVTLDDYGTALSLLTATGALTSYTLPGLHLFSTLDLAPSLDLTRAASARLLPSGHLCAWSGEHEFAALYLFGKGLRIDSMPQDTLHNPSLPPPTRPTISNLQWLAGTQFISTSDLDVLIGGPGRPMSRRQVEMEREAAREEREAARRPVTAAGGSGGSGSGGAGEGGGVFAGMAKTLRERTEKLTMTTESLDRLGDHSASFADDVSKYVTQQKRKALLGGITGKWF